MNRRPLILSVLLFAFTAPLVWAIPVDKTRYEGISERNVFGLNPPPKPVVAVAPTNPPPQVELKLSGITRIGGDKKAWLTLSTQNKDSRDTRYITLAEGQRMDDVEVISIGTGNVVVKHGSARMDLSITNHDNILASVPVTLNGATPVMGGGSPFGGIPAVPGMPGVPQPAVFNGGGVGGTAVPFSPTPTIRSMPATGPNGQAVYQSLPIPGSVTATAAGARAMTLDQATANMEIQRVLTRNQVEQGVLPPLPPTDLTPPSPTTQVQVLQPGSTVPAIPTTSTPRATTYRGR